MNRIEAEKAVADKLIELIKVYHEYNPDGTYLTMAFIDGSIQCWNDHNEKDILKPMDFRADPDGQFVRCGDIDGRISFLRSKRFSYLRRWFNVHHRRKG